MPQVIRLMNVRVEEDTMCSDDGKRQFVIPQENKEENLLLLFKTLEDEGWHTFNITKTGKNMYNVEWEG